MDITDKLNMTMLCDFYELTMGNGYLEAGLKDRITYFDIFFRDVPDHGGYAICAGLERIIAYIQDLHFSEEDIEYLRSKDLFSERFLDYLRDFKFTGDVWAIPEGTPIFPREPIITVRAPAIQAQLVETFLLLIFNHQSLVATKTNRIVRAAEGRVVLEFGSRRAQGTDAAISGARAAYIGGCAGTACTISDQLFGVPAGGTMAHAWVQMFDSEYEAFKTYCEVFPTNATLLVDTYNTLKSGVPNAIKAFTTPEVCPDCHGTGQVQVRRQTPMGVFATSSPCGRCGGKGKIIHQPCPDCRGSGAVRRRKTIQVSIPAGIDNGQTISVRGQGSAGKNGGPAGDLLVTITVRPHELFRREGTSVLCDAPITFAQAVLGAELEIPTIDGKVKYDLPEGTQSGTTFRLKGKGIPAINGRGRGDQYVTVYIETPRNLNREQKEALKKFAESVGDNNYEERRKFFRKFKK